MGIVKKILAKLKHEFKFGNTNYYTRVSEKILKARYRKALSRKIRSLPPITLNTDGAHLTVAILANRKNFFESVAALYSFCFWERNVCVHYHEDGSLTSTEIDFLSRIFPGIKVFKRADENTKVKEHLLGAGLTNCAALRDHFIFSLRLFDMVIEKETPYLLQIDSDVLFYSKPGEVLDIVAGNQYNGCYNLDLPAASYTFTDAVMNTLLPVPIIRRFNAGLFLHNFNEGLFSFSEDILKKHPESARSWHLEQTLFAMYASVRGSFIALPKEYDLGRKERNLGNQIVSEHFVHSTGHDFHKDFLKKLVPVYTRQN